ncbi:alpha/beta fold hydrolase [Polaromonas sp. LjRoot131]|uniref:alpha/beta fold hydrolase n=1 Tax=Polaromonas sp. LjRoot131 TaxID=3342262 RepID=UPI003ECDE9B9
MEVAMAPLRLVLLPGMDGTGDLLSPLLKALPPSLPVEVVRYPGHEALGYEELQKLVLARLTTAPFVLLGESFSGPLAISIAAEQPTGLRGLILSCTFAKTPRPALAFLSSMADNPLFRRIPPHALTRVVAPFLLGGFAPSARRLMLEQALRQLSPQTMIRRMQEVLRVDVRDKLKQIQVPVMYLQAKQDRVVPGSAAESLKQNLPSMEIVRLDGPHCLLQASAAPAALAIQAFCGKLSSSHPLPLGEGGGEGQRPANTHGATSHAAGPHPSLPPAGEGVKP